MLTELLIRDEINASLGKTERTFIVRVSGKRISQRVAQENKEYNSRKLAVFHMLIPLIDG
jgi:hypothetical protein